MELFETRLWTRPGSGDNIYELYYDDGTSHFKITSYESELTSKGMVRLLNAAITDLVKRSGWIDVNEELPERDKVVLVYHPEYGICLGKDVGYLPGSVNWWANWIIVPFRGAAHKFKSDGITHWMPLPDLPDKPEPPERTFKVWDIHAMRKLIREVVRSMFDIGPGGATLYRWEDDVEANPP